VFYCSRFNASHFVWRLQKSSPHNAWPESQSQEFLDRNGRELVGDKRRFETLHSLGLPRSNPVISNSPTMASIWATNAGVIDGHRRWQRTQSLAYQLKSRATPDP